MAIGIAIDLHRIYVAVYKTSTRTTQFAFNLWLTGAALFYFATVYGETLYYFVPLPKNGVRSNNLTGATTTAFKSSQQDQPLSSLPQQTTTPQPLNEIKFWIDCGLHLVLGFGLKAILNQRRQLDLEREEQQGRHHHLLFSSDKELPTPVASASSVEGFKTEADMSRLQLRVPTWPRLFMAIWFLWLIYDGTNHIPHFASVHHHSAREYAVFAISFLQGVAGLYILYRKSFVLTQWLFYSFCITTAYQILDTNMGFWKKDLKKNWTELAGTIDDDEGGTIFRDFAENYTDEEVIHIRVSYMTGATLFYVGRLWVVWRPVIDLKARNARVARATDLSRERELRVEKLGAMDDIYRGGRS
ncbi:hypothetical protein BG015_005412 [Linnemannia schmuckeri]|uniref:Uncharacterized protein n=1 Tax=Linnemannia schmuckeri TaxID=64567 RepID=A0A9P5R5W2_9FUNG|nr:hypothetical protein BG015_005412 [Linnemannia schmuckeri]